MKPKAAQYRLAAAIWEISVALAAESILDRKCETHE
jgi:hypothetical protein